MPIFRPEEDAIQVYGQVIGCAINILRSLNKPSAPTTVKRLVLLLENSDHFHQPVAPLRDCINSLDSLLYDLNREVSIHVHVELQDWPSGSPNFERLYDLFPQYRALQASLSTQIL